MTVDGAQIVDGLRVLAADEDEVALERTAGVLRGLGHRVTSYAVDVTAAGQRVAADDPDVAVVVVHRDEAHALALIAEIGAYARGPVIALLDGDDADFVRRAADRGVDAYARQSSPADLQSAIEVALRRHGEVARLQHEVAQLEGALDRRALIERAKGMLMERRGVGEREAFEQLRASARSTNRTVVATARALLEGAPPA